MKHVVDGLCHNGACCLRSLLFISNCGASALPTGGSLDVDVTMCTRWYY